MQNKAILVGPCKDHRHLDYSEQTSIVFVDGGLKHRKTKFNKNKNWQSIGDGDSSKERPKIKLPRQKNESDLQHALKLLPKNVHWVEAFGLFPELKHEQRLDHRLFNLGEIYNYVQKTGVIVHLNEFEIMLPTGKNNLDFKGTFSLVAFDDIKLKINGRVSYPLTRTTSVKKLSSHTLSNIDQGAFTTQSSHPLLLILKR
jgi:thiamine pyrophosphokinase